MQIEIIVNKFYCRKPTWAVNEKLIINELGLHHGVTYTHRSCYFLPLQSEYFHGLSKEPVISSLSAHETLDSSGGQAITVDLYCTINGIQKVVENH